MRANDQKNGSDIDNSSIPGDVGILLKVYQTLAVFMRYIRTEDKPEQEAIELLASSRKAPTGATQLLARGLGE